MDPMIEIAYLGAMLMLGVLAFRMMSQGWGAMANTKSDSYGSVMKAYGKTHPEMKEVKDGDELMGINFTPDPEFIKKYKNGDYHLNQSLQDRIAELEDEDDDEDEGDGDIIVRV